MFEAVRTVAAANGSTDAMEAIPGIYEDARDAARSLVGTDAFEQSRRESKRIEMRLAYLNRIVTRLVLWVGR